MKNRIRELRAREKLTQAALASELGIAQGTLSNWEKGKFDIDNSSLQKLADFFYCSTDYILCRDTLPSPPDPARSEFHLTPHEKQIILAYRANPSARAFVDRILEVDSLETKKTKEA